MNITVREDTTGAGRELRNQMESWYNVKKKIATWSTAVAAVNGVIRTYNDMIARKGTGDGDGTSGTDAPTAP